MGLHFSGTATVDTAHPSVISFLNTGSNQTSIQGSGGGNILFDTAGSYLQISSLPAWELVPQAIVWFRIHGYNFSSPTLALSVSLDSGNTWSPCRWQMFRPCTHHLLPV